MSVLNVVSSVAGQVPNTIGVNSLAQSAPSVISIYTNDVLSDVLTAGYLNQSKQVYGSIYNNQQMALVYTTDLGCVWLRVLVSGNDTSLESTGEAGVVALPTVANQLCYATNTLGALAASGATRLFNAGGLDAGLSGTAGTLRSYSSTASRGYFEIAATANAGDTATVITNAEMGQATTLTIPDPADATADFVISPSALVNNNLVKASGTAGLIVDAGIDADDVQLSANIIAATTADIGGAGAGPISVVVAGLTADSVVVATVESSSSPVSVVACTATATGFDITFSADPGAACLVNYIAFIAAQ